MHPAPIYAIHRVKDAVSDTGLRYPLLRQIAYVQLDKALELFLSKNYNEDDDIKLLILCALIADINNDEVTNAMESDTFLTDIRRDAIRFSLDKEVQPTLISEEMEIWDQTVGKALEHAAWKKEGQNSILALISWLATNGRADDIPKIATDQDYLNKLLEEYQSTQKPNT